jgi:hypothetical protein
MFDIILEGNQYFDIFIKQYYKLCYWTHEKLMQTPQACMWYSNSLAQSKWHPLAFLDKFQVMLPWYVQLDILNMHCTGIRTVESLILSSLSYVGLGNCKILRLLDMVLQSAQKWPW